MRRRRLVDQRIADLIVSRRYFLLALGCVLAVVAALTARQLEFDQSIENMFADDDPVLVSYKKLQRTFGGNKIVLAVYEDAALLASDRTGIRRLSSITQRLGEVDGIRAAFGLHDPLGELIVNPNNAIAKRALRLFEGTTHSADGTMAAVACVLDPDDEPDAQVQAIADLRRVMQSLPAPLRPGFVTGEPVIVADGFRLITRDGRQLAFASAILLAITIAVFFRRVRWLLIPVVVVQVVLTFTRSVIAAVGIRMTMISSVLNSVAMVITVATLVHFIVRFEAFRKQGMPVEQALRETLRVLAAPVFWALLTDAAGFAALMIAKVGPIHDYGVVMTLATFMVLVTMVLFLPALATLGRSAVVPASNGVLATEPTALALDRMTDWVMARPKRVWGVIVLMTAISAVGLRFLEVETDFTKNFRRGSDIVRGYELVETRLGGAGVLEVILPAPPTLSWDYLRRVEALQNDLQTTLGSETGLTKVMSLVDGLTLARLPALEALPRPMQNTALLTAIGLLKAKMPTFFGSMVGRDPQTNQPYYRVMLRALERQPAATKKALIQQVEAICQAHFPEAEVTGFYVLLSNLIDSVLRDQRRSFAAAMLGIFAVMALAFRSPRVALLAIIPNVLPILLVTGSMGWISAAGFPIKTNLGVALIAAVSLGLSVDCTIHYVIAFQRATRLGENAHRAVRTVNRTVARALIVSTVALIVGFAVLCRSEFVPTVYFGAMVSLAMLGGLLGNLIVLPVLIKSFPKKQAHPL